LPLDPLLLSTAVEAAIAAGRLQRQYFRQSPTITKKGRIDLVTAADLAVERAFREVISARFPDHGILGEEGAGGEQPVEASHRWIIDPVDGTTNFAHGLAFFCVSIALEVRGRVELGVVYDPIADELFTAERDLGARLNGVRIRTTACGGLVDALLCTGFPYSVREDRRKQLHVFAAFLEEAQAVRRLGSAALDLCYVACGRLDGYWEEKIQPWDIAAGALIVEEAGGLVHGMDGSPFDPFAGHVLASTPGIHDAMLDVVSEVRRETTA
jgi:myo-inositol-1(or 4)-monophosphatase